MLKGMFLSVERRRQDWRGTKNVYTFGANEKRGQCDAADRKDWEQLARYRGEDSRTMRSIWQERLGQPARLRGEDSRTEQSS